MPSRLAPKAIYEPRIEIHKIDARISHRNPAIREMKVAIPKSKRNAMRQRLLHAPTKLRTEAQAAI
jgi:hypothetical protein